MIVKASKLDPDKRNSIEKTSAVLNRALDVVEKELNKRLNKSNILSYMKAMFKFEIGKLNYEKFINKTATDNKAKSQPTHYLLEIVNTMRPNVYKALSQTCKVSFLVLF